MLESLLKNVKNPIKKAIEYTANKLHNTYDVCKKSYIDPNIIKEWSTIVGSSNLWLAPKLPPDTEFPETLLNFSDTFLLDAYSKTKFGGTGHSSDWKTFSKCKVSYPEKKWILAGGIGPKNVAEALLQTKADIIDLNSGVEQAPGQKDPLKIKSVFSILSL